MKRFVKKFRHGGTDEVLQLEANKWTKRSLLPIMSLVKAGREFERKYIILMKSKRVPVMALFFYFKYMGQAK